MENSLVITPRLSVPLDEFRFTFVRSGGPGGQNVNKVASKAVLHWQVVTTPSLNDDVRERFLRRFKTKISKTGELVLTSQEYRDQGRNITACLEKVQAMILEIAIPPKSRKPTKPTLGSKKRRLEAKKKTSDRKASRQRGAHDAY